MATIMLVLTARKHINLRRFSSRRRLSSSAESGDSESNYARRIILVLVSAIWSAVSTSGLAADPPAIPQRQQVVVVGSGITGLCAGALLAKQDYEVTVLEMHPTLIGGHARTLSFDGVEVSAGPQYVWNFGPSQIGGQVLSRLGLSEQVPFDLLDPNGFDQLIVDGEVLNVPIGLQRWKSELITRFPDEQRGLDRFFATIQDLFSATRFLHDSGLYLAEKPAMIAGLLGTPTVRFGAKVRTLQYSERTLRDLFDDCRLSPKVRRFLYGQAGLFAENESNVSIVVYAAAIGYYHQGPRVPRHGFRSLVDGLCGVIRDAGGKILTGKRVVELGIDGFRVVSVRCEDGSSYPSDIVISTLSPRLTARLVPGANLRRFDYHPSNSAVACYLKVVDFPAVKTRLRGRNVWWQDGQGPVNFDNPDMTAPPRLIAVASPTANQSGANSGDADAIVIFAPGNFEQAWGAAQQGTGAHDALRDRMTEALLSVLDQEVFPGIQGHITSVRALTPWDIQQELGAERGNVYGRRLDAFDVLHSETSTPYASNLHVANASIGLPGVAIGFQTASLLVPADGRGVQPLWTVIVKAVASSLFRSYRESFQSFVRRPGSSQLVR